VRKHVVEAKVERFALAASLTTAGRVLSRNAFANSLVQLRAARDGSPCIGCIPGILEASGVVIPNDVLPLPGGAVHPHQSGVRLGKCQASKKVKSADWNGAMLSSAESTYRIVLIVLAASSPSRENASQNNRGDSNHCPSGHPRQCVSSARSPVAPPMQSCPASDHRQLRRSCSSSDLLSDFPRDIH